MLIVGERINTTRKKINEAVRSRDTEFIQNEAKTQVAAGATYVDVNAGTSVKDEVDDLKWLVEVVQEAVDVPLCLDSANPVALEQAIKLHKGQPLVNSITAEKERVESVLPLVKEHDTLVVALTMDDSGMPCEIDDRVKIAADLVDICNKAGVPNSSIYFDPLIRPISTNPSEAVAAIKAVERIMKEFDGVHTVCGLSNVSFGLPKRSLLNRTFFTLMLAAGLDGVIIDPTDTPIMSTLCAARAILNLDDFCMEYITAEREGRLV